VCQLPISSDNAISELRAGNQDAILMQILHASIILHMINLLNIDVAEFVVK
jgi:hypothetical protein